MLASTHFDLVVGIDIHTVGVPVPPSPVPVPTPVPMPFIGLVFDPAALMVSAAIGMAMGGGPGLVMINGMPVTNTGTNVTNFFTLPHVPAPGVTFVPPTGPGNDAELFFGAQGVNIGGSSAVRLGDIALSCSDPVRLPTSVVLALPKGAPVFINRPMVPDTKAIAAAGAAHGAAKALGAAVRGGKKLFRDVRQTQKRSSGWGRVARALRRAIDNISPKRYRDRLKHAVCFVTGHPVDVATGRVFTDHVDFELPGPLPISFERVYSSSLSWRDGPLGFGWSHSLDQAVWCERGKVVYLAEDGREIEFLVSHFPNHVIWPGNQVYEATNRLTLKALGKCRWEIETAEGIVHEFAPVPGAPDPQRAKLMVLRNRDRSAMIKLHYDERGLLARVEDSAGRVLYFVNDERGKLRAITLPDPNGTGWVTIVKYEIDEKGDLVQVTDALGHTWAFMYDGHLLVQETDRTGLSFYFQYDNRGSFSKCIRTWGDGGIYDHVIAYDPRNRKTFVEDSLGRTTVYTMDELGMVVAVMDPHAKVTRYTYDPESGQEASEMDPLGRETRREFDDRGNCVAIFYPDGTCRRAEYRNNLPVRMIDPCGGEWQWQYDSAGRVKIAINPLGQATRYRYEGGLLREIQDPMGATIALRYDAAKNVCAVRFPNGAEEVLVHDALGRCVEHRTASGAVWKYWFDLCNREIVSKEPDGNIVRLAYL